MATTNDLTANPRNPRKITDKRIAQLRKSLMHFGDLSGVVWNCRGGRLIGGHQRCAAWSQSKAQQITITERYNAPTKQGTVAIGYIDVDGERHAYREVDWDETTEKAANLAANRAAGAWDDAGVSEFFKELSSEGFDLSLTMFDKEEIDAFSVFGDDGTLNGDPADNTDKAEKDADVATSVILGDLYALGDHRLLCGDALNDESIKRVLGGQTPDICFTDPPYGMNLDTNYAGMHDAGHKYKAVHGDDKPYKPDHLFRQFPKIKEMILWGADYYCQDLPRGGSWYCWDKRVEERHEKFIGNHLELAWSMKPHKREVIRYVWNGFMNMHEQDQRTRCHPTQKPLHVVKWFFERLKGETVVDPFAGSGTTLIASEQCGRKCMAIELDPTYCQVIINRWEHLSGREAKKIS